MKKVISILLAVMMLAVMAIPAFAEEVPQKPYRNSDSERNIADTSGVYFICEDEGTHKLGMSYAISAGEVTWDETEEAYFASVTFDIANYFEAFSTVYPDHEFSEDVPSSVTLKYKWDPSAVDANLPGVTGLWVLTENAAQIKVKCKAPAAEEYTVTYTDGTGKEDIFANRTYTVPAGSATPAFEGTPTLYGYDFIGWDPAMAETVTTDATYTAKWQAHAFTVTFDSNGGSSVASKGVAYRNNIGALPVPEKAGFEFIGWYAGSEKIDENYTVLGDVALVAQWRKAEEVKFGYTIESKIKVPEEFKNDYPDEISIKTALLRKSAWFEEKGKDYDYEFMEITLVKYNKDTKKWESAEQGEYPGDEHEFVIPYPKGAGKTGYTFVVTHFITYGEDAGEVEVVPYTKGSDGLHIKTETLSPFCVAYAKGTTTVIKPGNDTNINNDKYKLRVETEVELPYNLRNKFDDTDEMKRAIWKKSYSEARRDLDYYIVYRDVDLLEWNPITRKWVALDEDEYPSGGVEAVLSYPNGTSKNGYDFVLTGLVTEGPDAGEIKILDYTKEKDGLHIELEEPLIVGITYAVYDNGISIKPADKPSSSVVVDLNKKEEIENPNTGVSLLIVPAAATAVVSISAAVVLGKKKKK